MNPYIGCSFDCIYCYVNGSKYSSKTSDYTVKSNAKKLSYYFLKKKFKNNEKALFLIGSSCDPYMDIEKELFLTRDILKIFKKFSFPIHIVTKSDLILRDIDLLKEIDKLAILPEDLKNKLNSNIIISFSFSTVNKKISNIMEPFAPSPKKRLKAMKKLSKENFTVGASFMPILPFLSDSQENINNLVNLVSKYDGEYLIHGSLSLFGSNLSSSRNRYESILKKYFPEASNYNKNIFFDKKLLVDKNYPKKTYIRNISKKVDKACKHYCIRSRIVI